MRKIFYMVILLGLALLLIWGIELFPPTHRIPAQHYMNYGKEETGAVNLVSAIYLGYRAFDTLGETIVLLLVVSGVAMLFKKN